MCICGRKGCKGLCNIRLGNKLYSFYKTTNDRFRQSYIGDTEDNGDLTVIGDIYYSPSEDTVDNYGRILKVSENTTLKSFENPLFEDFNTIRHQLYSYAEYIDSEDDIDSAVNWYRDLISGKGCLLPVDFDNQVEVAIHKIEGETTYSSFKAANVRWITWRLDENGERTCLIKLRTVDDKIPKEVAVDMFGIDFRPSNYNISATSNIYKVIRYNKAGYIEPIRVSDGMRQIIIDNENVYYTTDSYTFHEVGNWNGNNIVYNENIDVKLRSFAEKYKSGIARLRQYIAPYMVGKINKLYLEELVG